MDTITATVTGARHLRVARNGQDAAVAASGASLSGAPWTAAVVCDGCSAGASSEVGARLGAALALASIARRLAAGEPVDWREVQREIVSALAALVDRMGEDRGQKEIYMCFEKRKLTLQLSHFLRLLLLFALRRRRFL